MKLPTKPQNIEEKIDYVKRTIRRLGVCSISTHKLTPEEVEAMKEHFSIEQVMGYTKFKKPQTWG